MLFNRQQGCGMRQPNMMGMGQPMGQPMGQQMMPPIIEPTQTQCIQKEFFHEVPHVCPKHTHIVNKHIFKHTYTPQFSCSEENQMINVDCGSCSQF